jgi:Zn-dependent protease
MGHVAAMRRYGLQATAPMFIPGFGALIRMQQHPATTQEESRIGLAGPIWGLGAAAACFLIYITTQQPFWAALTHTGAMINLFNLMPIWGLDGDRGFKSLNRNERWLATAPGGAARD